MSASIGSVVANSMMSENEMARVHPSRVESRDLKKEDFLYLLTEQLSNQNPLEPMKNEDFISQLATFSHLSNSTEQTSILKDLKNSIEILRDDFRRVHNLPSLEDNKKSTEKEKVTAKEPFREKAGEHAQALEKAMSKALVVLSQENKSPIF